MQTKEKKYGDPLTIGDNIKIWFIFTHPNLNFVQMLNDQTDLSSLNEDQTKHYQCRSNIISNFNGLFIAIE